MNLFIGIVLFNIIMYFVIFSANADASFESIGTGGNMEGKINATTDQDIDSESVTNWYSGFSVSVFGLPSWVNIFYVSLQGLLLSLGIYAMIRGLN